MQIVLEDAELKSPFVVQPRRPMNDDEFFEFCVRHPQLRMERTAQGDILIMPPAGDESSFQSSEVGGELRNWARRDGRGVVFDSSAGFVLPDGSCLSPDAAWILRSRLKRFSKEEKRKFLPLCPDFVIEVLSPSDRLSQLKTKMRHWVDNGTRLAWLLDPDHRTAYVYRPGREPERLVNLERVTGDAPVAGFVLELAEIWAGI
jgi:Uma2 family endonuclease